MKKHYSLLIFTILMTTCTHRSAKRQAEPVAHSSTEIESLEYTVESLRVMLIDRLYPDTSPAPSKAAHRSKVYPVSASEPVGYDVPE